MKTRSVVASKVVKMMQASRVWQPPSNECSCVTLSNARSAAAASFLFWELRMKDL